MWTRWAAVSWAVVACVSIDSVAEALPVRSLGRTEGLPSGQVHDLAQAGDGRIWLVGPAGATRYDGITMTVLGPGEGLSTQGIRAVEVDTEGHLWLGTDQGLERIRSDGAIAQIAVGDAWPWGVIERILDHAGTIWVATAKGLVRGSESEGFVRVPTVPGSLVSDLAADSEGRVWVAGPQFGLYVGREDAFAPVALPILEKVAPLRALAARSGEIVVGGGGGLIRLDFDAKAIRAEISGLAVSAIASVGDELWVGTTDGLVWYPDGWSSEPRRLLPQVDVNRILIDREHNVWVATNSRGVYRFSFLRRALEDPPTPCTTQVFSLHRDGAEGLLVGGDQCSWATDQDLGVREVFEELSGRRVWDLVRLHDGSLLAATQDGLLASRDGRSWGSVGGPPSLRGPTRVVLERRPGDVWVGTVNGLFRLRDGSAVEVTDLRGRDLGYVYTLAEDAAGRLWVGTIGRGLYREGEEGLGMVIAEGIAPRGNVYSIAFDGKGTTVVLQDSRIVLLSSAGARPLATADGETISGWAAVVDENGYLWIGGSSGLMRYGPEDHRPGMRLARSSGLAADEFTTARSLLLMPDGRLLCGTAGGWTAIRTRALDTIIEPPAVAMGKIRWQQTEPRVMQERILVPHGRWTVDLGLYAPWYVDESALRFQYRLRGFDDAWSGELTPSDLPIRFTALPAGQYRLEARAGSTLTGWGDPATLYRFDVSAPWYLRWWAWVFYAVLGGALIAGAWRWRSHRLRDLAGQLERRVQRRTAELADANVALARLAAHDPLTELPNQRSMWLRLAELRALADRHAQPFGIVVFDLDAFKEVNDQRGHLEGDRVLQRVADRARRALRTSDMLARFGGEEFVVLLSNTEGSDAATVAEHLRVALADEAIALSDGSRLRVTASFGWAVWRSGETEGDVLRRADQAMYEAKAAGRNRVEPRPDPSAGSLEE